MGEKLPPLRSIGTDRVGISFISPGEEIVLHEVISQVTKVVEGTSFEAAFIRGGDGEKECIAKIYISPLIASWEVPFVGLYDVFSDGIRTMGSIDNEGFKSLRFTIGEGASLDGQVGLLKVREVCVGLKLCKNEIVKNFNAMLRNPWHLNNP